MSMNTPIGNITQTTPIKDFKELDEMQNEQYLLGIDDNTVGNGSKISLENLINSSISADSDNLITKGTDDRLLVNTPVEIGDLSNLTTTNKSTLVAAINEVDSDLATEVTNRVNAVSGEATARQNADNNLQSQIDAITAASDVTDIVGTYAELQAYDTTGLSNNSIIKVLQDESRQNETTYYRWVITDGVGAWVLIGGEGPFTTVAYVDGNFVTKATVGDLNNLTTSDKSSVVNAMNELASVLDPTQTADYIKNSKAIYSGEVSENALILPQIKEMAHSTFDLTKFTVVGSPVITDDGIASGFSGENYLKLPNFDVTGKSFEFDLGKVYVPASTGASHALFNILVGPTEASSVLNFAVGSVGEMYVSGANKNAAVKYLTGYSLNNYYWLKIGSDNSTIVYCKISTDGVNYTTITTPLLNPYTLFTYLGIGRGNNTTSYWLGDYDLRQFKLSVDGVEVFSGNQTGIDTIKPDNYTVVGSPTISADGIASGFSTSDCLTIDTSTIDWTKPYKIKIKCNTGNITNQNGNLTCHNMPIIRLNDKRLQFSPATTFSNISSVGAITDNVTALDNTDYYVIATFDGTTYTFEKSLDDENYTLVGTSTIIVTNLSTGGTSTIGTGYGVANDQVRVWNGTIDLNSIKIYVYGNLVHQPCLKIPYTESKTGSKIVDSIYRDRISDMYEQFGYAPYYTLSDTNFTLPQGEIYGMIERNNVEIGVPIPTLSSTLRDNEIWLKGDSVAKVDYPRLYAIYGDDYEDSANPTDNDHFRLPNFVGNIMQGIDATDTFGYISAGLPNITGSITLTNLWPTGNGADGSLVVQSSEPGNNAGDGGTRAITMRTLFDAWRSSSIYGNSTTVQPPAIKVRVKTRYK